MAGKNVALITGASSGIGLCFARQLAREGHSLLLVARREDRLKELQAGLQSAGVSVHLFPLDLLKPGAGNALADYVSEHGLFVDLLVNNAGYGTTGPFAAGDLAKEVGMVDLHCRMQVELTGRFLSPMLKRGRGGIIAVASAAAFLPMPYMATYAATKAFMLSFSQALAAEVRDQGVRVLCVCPGATSTEFQQVSGVPETKIKPPRYVAPEVVVAEALRDYRRGKWVSVPGAENVVFSFLARALPHRLAVGAAAKLIKR